MRGRGWLSGKHLPCEPGGLCWIPRTHRRIKGENWFHKVWPLHTCHNRHDHTLALTFLKNAKKGRRGRGKERQKNKNYTLLVIVATGCVCRWIVILSTVFAIPETRSRILHSPFHSPPPHPHILLAVPTGTHPLPCSWNPLKSTWLTCPSMPSSDSPACSKSPVTVSAQSGPLAPFLRLSALEVSRRLSQFPAFLS